MTTQNFQFYSAEKILDHIEKSEFSTIAQIMLKAEHELTHRSEEEIRTNLKTRMHFMRDAIAEGRDNPKKTFSGMVGGDSKRVADMEGNPELFLSEVMRKGSEYALGVMESNARMGKIVAAPTAGSAGIIPGAVWAMVECFDLDEEKAIDGLLTASAIGVVIAAKATFSAAKAGCQAEVGSSSAMAAAAVSAMRGMSPERCINAASIALKNMLGLACDPIAGLVEAPCTKRNAIGVVHAMTASDMSLAGVTSVVPFDEVVMAMNDVAKNMNENIRETSKGGLATTPTGKRIMKKIMDQKKKGQNLPDGMQVIS